MNVIANTETIRHHNFSLIMCIDLFNNRIRVDDVTGDIVKAIVKAENIAKEKGVEKLIFKTRKENYALFMEKGYQCEAIIDRYFLGSNLYFFSKYYNINRKNSSQWMKEDEIVKNVCLLDQNLKMIHPPTEYKLKQLQPEDAKKLASLYEKVFQIYPTPLNDMNYIVKTMTEGTIYFGFYFDGEIVSAASAEVNSFYKNAELTDCATLQEHRKHGLMKILLKELENELKANGIFCAYSIARALSFGMNAALHQLDFKYRGRLMNNCYIFDKLENMNVWVKDLSVTR